MPTHASREEVIERKVVVWFHAGEKKSTGKRGFRGAALNTYLDLGVLFNLERVTHMHPESAVAHLYFVAEAQAHITVGFHDCSVNCGTIDAAQVLDVVLATLD